VQISIANKLRERSTGTVQKTKKTACGAQILEYRNFSAAASKPVFFTCASGEPPPPGGCRQKFE
jgi:hypothetical protein